MFEACLLKEIPSIETFNSTKCVYDEEAKQEIGMTIEAIDNIEIAYELSKKYNVEMPIITSIYNVLYNKIKYL